jgi:hypothetical protein
MDSDVWQNYRHLWFYLLFDVKRGALGLEDGSIKTNIHRLSNK